MPTTGGADGSNRSVAVSRSAAVVGAFVPHDACATTSAAVSVANTLVIVVRMSKSTGTVPWRGAPAGRTQRCDGRNIIEP